MSSLRTDTVKTSRFFFTGTGVGMGFAISDAFASVELSLGFGSEMSTAFVPQAFFEELKKRKNSDLNGQKSGKSEQKGQEGPFLKPLKGQKSDMLDRKC